MKITAGLSARLLVLTFVFVMLAEVLIYVPSIARYRVTFLQERIAKAQIASLALEAAPGGTIDSQLETELLRNAMVRAVSLKREETRQLMLSDGKPVSIAATYDLRGASFTGLLQDAFVALWHQGNRSIQVIDDAPEMGGDYIAVVMDEDEMFAGMLAYSTNILLVSLLISGIAGTLLYLVLLRVFVRPMQHLSRNMLAFAENPEDANRVITVSGRKDEIGTAEQQLQHMQKDLRDALTQKTRLADLGAAVARINHDLRNMLSSAQLVSDRLRKSGDPTTQALLPPLMSALQRAIDLCRSTLDYGRQSAPKARPVTFSLLPLVEDQVREMAVQTPRRELRTDIPADLVVHADPDHIQRVLENLLRNSMEAVGETGTLTIKAEVSDEDGTIHIDVADTGPGLSDSARSHLFQPFKGSGKLGGTGLGLVNARELMRAQGGDLVLVNSDRSGTAFRLILPASRAT